MKTKKNNIIQWIILAIIITIPVTMTAQGIDPLRASAIKIASMKAKRVIEAQETVQGLQTTGHIWTNDEVRATTEFQKAFNDYLNTFHGILSAAATMYGVFNEVTRLAKNLSELSSVVTENPTNGIALAFSVKRNDVYSDVIMTSVNIINDIRKVFFKAKMTEQERNRILSGIKPQLHELNRHLRHLVLMIRYTSFEVVWREIVDRAYTYSKLRKSEILGQCRRDWMTNCRSVH